MPGAGRQIWEIRVPKDVELTLLENRIPKDIELTPQKKIEVSKSKTKIMKKEPREMEN